MLGSSLLLFMLFFYCFTFHFFTTLIVNIYTSDWRRLAMRGPSNGDSSSLLSPIVAEKKFAWISSVSNRLSYDRHHQSICERIVKDHMQARVRKHVWKLPFCWAVLTWGVPTLIFENWDVQLWEKLVPSSHEGSKWTLPCRCKVQTRNIGELYICKGCHSTQQRLFLISVCPGMDFWWATIMI